MRTLILFLVLFVSDNLSAAENCTAFLNYDLPKLHSTKTGNLCELAQDKALLIVNTISHFGYTRQFEGLEALHKTYIDQGLIVVGFASNDFNQEAKTEAEVDKVCSENFGVSFTMISPSYVTGDRANPIFREINRRRRELQ